METKETKRFIGSSIFRMNNEAVMIEDELLNNGGELTEELEERIQHIGETKEEVVDQVSELISSVTAGNSAIAEEIKRLQGLKKSRERTAEVVKESLRKFMLDNDISRIETPTHIAKITKGRAKVEFSESLEMEGYDKMIERFGNTLPPYIQLKASISKTELKKWVEDGNPTRSAEILSDPSIQIK